MGGQGDDIMTSRNATRGEVARALLGFLAFGVGLYLVVRITAELVLRAEGVAAGGADCDDCGVTVLLDNVGWLVAAVAGYLLLAVALLWFAKRHRRVHAGTISPTG